MGNVFQPTALFSLNTVSEAKASFKNKQRDSDACDGASRQCFVSMWGELRAGMHGGRDLFTQKYTGYSRRQSFVTPAFLAQ